MQYALHSFWLRFKRICQGRAAHPLVTDRELQSWPHQWMDRTQSLKVSAKASPSPNPELYSNHITGTDVTNTTVLLECNKGAEATCLWQHPVGKSKALSFSLSHEFEKWNQAEFNQSLPTQ